MLRPPLLGVIFALLAACGEPGATQPPGAQAAPTPRRLLVVGWDGASFRAIDPLLARGALPNLAALIARGVRAPLESTLLPISSAAWATATTGKGPGEHGVFAFHEPVPESYALRLVSARSVQAAPLWRLLSGRGLSSVVLGVPLTYPPEPILGTLVCGMLAPPESTFTWPAALSDALRARGYLTDIDPWLEERTPSLEEALTQLDLRQEVLDELLAGPDWRLAWIVFKELDVLSHFSYENDFPACVTPLYQRLDALLGHLVERVGPETNVVLLSDHGFRSYERGWNLHAWLIEKGLAVRRRDASSEPLPEGPFASVYASEAAQRLDELDLGRSQAFAYACEGNFGSLRLNLRGREPEGIVAPEDAPAVLARIEGLLFEHPWVRSVWRGTDVLPGTERGALPDVLFALEEGTQAFAERGSELQGAYDPSVPDHDRTGIFVAAGPDVAPGRTPERRLELLDVTPLALHLLGQPVPAEMRGRVPLELLLAPRPVERVPESAFAALSAPEAGAPYTPAEIEALEASLRKLGYGD